MMKWLHRLFPCEDHMPPARKIGEAPQPTEEAEPADILQQIMTVAGPLAAVLLVVAVLWVFLFAWRTVHDLFAMHLLADPLTATLAAGASVGMLAVLLLVTFGIRHNRMRGLATLYAAAWFSLVIALVAIKTVFDAAASPSENLKSLATSVLDTAPWLANAGSVLAAILAGLCIAPVASMFGAAKHPAGDMTEDEARARYAWNAGKLIISGASIGLAVLFGANVIGINVLVALLLGLVLDVGFLVALQKAESSSSAGDHRHAGTWTRFVWLYGVLIALLAVKTIPALARLMGTPVAVPGVTDNPTLHSLGSLAYITAVGMGILTIVLTATATIRQRREMAQGAQHATIKPPRSFARRLASQIQAARTDLHTLRAAFENSPPAAQIVAPASVSLPSEGAGATQFTSLGGALEGETFSEKGDSANSEQMAGQGLPATPKRG
jgi:hypothetical protein